jgi:hypothetical protein
MDSSVAGHILIVALVVWLRLGIGQVDSGLV